MKYRIEETKGMAKTVGNYAVKRNGKIVRYFAELSEAHDFVQSALADESHPNF